MVLYSGLYIPPRRAMDYIDFKIRGAIDRDNDNYLDKSHLVFNKYKTSKVYDTQKVKIPSSLKIILNKWIDRNPTDYLLFDNKKQPLNGTKLNQRINKIFDGKQVGVNGMRKSYLSNKYGHTIELEKTMKEDFEKAEAEAQAATQPIEIDRRSNQSATSEAHLPSIPRP